MAKKIIAKVKCLGVRTAHNTGIFAVWNYSVYSLLIEYEDGKRELIEVKQGKMGRYLKYLDID